MQVLKDWHLVTVTMVISGITVLLLLLEIAIPYLRGTVTAEIDLENPTGKTVRFTSSASCIICSSDEDIISAG